MEIISKMLSVSLAIFCSFVGLVLLALIFNLIYDYLIENRKRVDKNGIKLKSRVMNFIVIVVVYFIIAICLELFFDISNLMNSNNLSLIFGVIKVGILCLLYWEFVFYD